MLDNNDFSHFGSSTRNRTSSMDFSGHLPISKRGRSGSISGRLRAASDLEEIGWIDKSQKGIIKDLIISGDATLRSALDKYENGDAHDLEVLIKRGMLARKQSLDLLDGLDMDFLTVGYDGTAKGTQGSFPYQDDFFLDHSFDDRSGSMGMGIMGQDSGSSCDQEVDLDLFRHRRSSSISNSLMGDGSFDLVGGSFFDGLGSYILPPPASSRKHSLSLPPALTTPRSGFVMGMGTAGEVDMSAYQSMAASLQAQSKANGQRNVAGRISPNVSRKSGGSAAAVPSSSSKKDSSTHIAVSPSAVDNDGQPQLNSKAPQSFARGVNTTSALPPPQMQNRMGGAAVHSVGQRQAVQGQGQGQYPPNMPSGSPAEVDMRMQQRQHQQQMDRDSYSQQQQQQQQQQHQRQQQLSEMQHNLMVRQMQMNGGRPQQSIMSHPHGHIHASNSHAHTQYAPIQPFAQSTFYQQQGAQHGHSGQGQRPGSGSGSGMQSKVHMQHMYPILEEGEGSSGAKVVSASNSAEVQSHLGKFMGDVVAFSTGGGSLSSGLSLYNPDGSHSNPPLPQGRGYVGAYSPEARRARIERFLAKRDKRVWTKKVKYDVRKNFADSRLRVKGRFVKKEDEELMKELLSI